MGDVREGTGPARRPRVLVIVPAFNEQDSVGSVIREIGEALPDAEVLVVDDGSTDATSVVARATGARVARLPVNLGIGTAVQTGYRVATDEGFDIALQIDGDGQHPPDQAPALIAAVLDGASYVIGSRFANGGEYRSTLARRGGIALFSRLVSFLAHQKLTDTTSGFRAADRHAIRLFAEHYPYDYPEVEAIILAHRCGLRIAEIQVVMRQRAAGRSSITPVRSLYYMIKVTLAVLVQVIGRKPLSEDPE